METAVQYRIKFLLQLHMKRPTADKMQEQKFSCEYFTANVSFLKLQVAGIATSC